MVSRIRPHAPHGHARIGIDRGRASPAAVPSFPGPRVSGRGTILTGHGHVALTDARSSSASRR